MRYAEQTLYTRAKDLVGDRDPRAHEFSVQLRAMDNDLPAPRWVYRPLWRFAVDYLRRARKAA